MKATQVIRARPAEDRKSLMRWAFPGVFLQEKGTRAYLCALRHAHVAATSAAEHSQPAMWTHLCRYLERSWHPADHLLAVCWYGMYVVTQPCSVVGSAYSVLQVLSFALASLSTQVAMRGRS